MIGQDILDLVKKPYRITFTKVDVIKALTGEALLPNFFGYHFPQKEQHDILYLNTSTIASHALTHEDLYLFHWVPGGKPGIKTSVVPSVSIKPECRSEAIRWLTEEWFGDTSMQDKAKEIVSDICDNGCVVFDYHIDEKGGPLVHVDTNLDQYVFPAAVFCPIFLRAKCFV